MRLSVLFACFVLCGSIHAQSTRTGTSISTGTSIISSGVVCQITTSVVPSGTVNTVYTPVQLTSVNCPGPVTWSVVAGALPTGLSLSPSGLITGVPTASGTASFTVKVVGTPSSITDIFDTGLTIDTQPVGGDPAPPDPALFSWCTTVACTPSNDTLVTVGDGSGSPCSMTGGTCNYTTSQISLALGSVGCGQTLVLQNVPMTLSAGTTRMQNNCDATHWITVTRDFGDTTFPSEGTRVTPCYAGMPSSALAGYPSYTCPSPARHMPLLLKAAASASLQFGPDAVTQHASYIRFVGIQWGRQTTYDLDFGILTLTNSVGCIAANIDCMNHQVDHVIFDRNIIQGDAQRQTTRAIDLGGRWISVKDSYLYDIFLSFAGGGGDSQVYHGGSGTKITNVGWWKLQNNFASASTMGCLFCGNFIAPVSPTTNFDGIPHDVWWTKQWFWKNPYWNAQIGQAYNETINIEGTNFGPVADQEFVVTPSAASIQQGTTFDLHNIALHDSSGGIDRVPYAPGTGGATIDGLACTFTTVRTVGVTPAGATTVVLDFTTGLGVNTSITITGAGAGGNNYLGTVTNISGTTLTISPATTLSVANNTAVNNPVCNPGGNSTHGLLFKNNAHAVGSGAFLMQNVITWTYIACSGVGVPRSDCTATTTVGDHVVVTNKVFVDGRAGTGFGNNRTINSTSTFTVTSGVPTASISIAPSASDLELQPSYPGAGISDAYGNSRQFCMLMFEVPNYTQGALTWKVDNITGGSSAVGTIQSGISGLVTGEAVYCAGDSAHLGNHTVSVTDGTATGTRIINVSSSAAILAMDGKPFTVKNGWEAKCISRGKFDYSTIENVWSTQSNGGFQPGECMLNQPANNGNQTLDGNGITVNYGPEFISNLDVNHIHCIHAGEGLIVAGLVDGRGIHFVKYKDIFIEDLNATRWRNGVQKTQFAGVVQFIGAGGTTVPSWTNTANPLTDHIKFDHFTVVGGTIAKPGLAHVWSIGNNKKQFQLGPWSFTNSILVVPGSTTFTNNNADVPDYNTASGSGANNTEAKALQGAGYTPPTPIFSSYDIGNNAIVDSTASRSPDVFTTTTIWQPLDSDPTLFGNYNLGVGGDYAVPAGSPYAAGGARCSSDGCIAIGADIAGILTNDAVVRWGAANPPTVDMLTVALMSTPNRLTKHMHGTVNGGSDTYSLPDTDAGYPAGYPRGIFFWAKHPTGNPWDIEKYNSTYAALHWITEDGDSADAATCVANGFSSCFLDPNAYKRFLTPVPMLPRTFTYGTVVTIDTPGPNTFVRTTNCEAAGTSTNINLGDVRSITSGPYLMTWGGTIDSGAGVGSNGPVLDPVNGVETFRNDYYYGGTLASGIFNDKESTFYVVGSGRVAWFFYQLSGGAYALQQWTINNTLTTGGTTANFPCGSGQTWWH